MQLRDAPLARLIEQIDEARSRNAALNICGGGTKAFYGGTPTGETLDLCALNGISSYEPSELVVTVRAGTLLAELEEALAEKGQCLPFEPPRFAAGGTVGGMVAAGLSGPARASAGAVRDHVLGVTLANGNGDLLSFGGQVAKNVAGYDVSRLLPGSLGILGVICEVSLKVLPSGVAAATIQFDCAEKQALEQIKRWSSKPLPISATAWHDGLLHVRLTGARAAVREACDALGGVAMAPDAASAWWSCIRDHQHEFFDFSADALRSGECLWRLSVPATTSAMTLPGRQFIEWNGAQRWWRSAAPAGVLRATAAAAGGHATLVRGADKAVGAFAPLSDVLMRIHRRLKQTFDPAHVFNPGRLYAEL